MMRLTHDGLKTSPRVMPPDEHVVMEVVEGWAHGRAVLIISNWVADMQMVREVRL